MAAVMWGGLMGETAVATGRRWEDFSEQERAGYTAKMPLVQALYDVLLRCEDVYGLAPSAEMYAIEVKHLRRPDGSRQMCVRFPGHLPDCIIVPPEA
jgi:hypothetical protein